MDEVDGIISGGTLILATEKHESRNGHKLRILNLQALKDNFAIGGSRIAAFENP